MFTFLSVILVPILLTIATIYSVELKGAISKASASLATIKWGRAMPIIVGVVGAGIILAFAWPGTMRSLANNPSGNTDLAGGQPEVSPTVDIANSATPPPRSRPPVRTVASTGPQPLDGTQRYHWQRRTDGLTNWHRIGTNDRGPYVDAADISSTSTTRVAFWAASVAMTPQIVGGQRVEYVKIKFEADCETNSINIVREMGYSASRQALYDQPDTTGWRETNPNSDGRLMVHFACFGPNSRTTELSTNQSIGEYLLQDVIRRR